MHHNFTKRQLDEVNRALGMADPLRDFRGLLDPLLQAREHLDAMYFDSALKASEKIAAMYCDPLDKFRQQIKAITDPLAQIHDALHQDTFTSAAQEQVQKVLGPYSHAQDWLKAYQKQEQERVKRLCSLLEDFSRQMKGIPARLREQLAVLMERGWCLDPEMPHVWGVDLVDAIHEGEEDEVQQWLIAYFCKRLDDIEKRLVERHPQRAQIVADAFRAHREGRYILSIPVLLAQAEGVIHDKHQRQLFSKKANTSLKGVLASLPDNDARSIFMSAFCIDTPLIRNTKDLPFDFDGLNRHAVLHGIDPNYGTEVNSLRAVSIVNLASYLASEEDNAAVA